MAFPSGEKPRPLEYPLYNSANENGATPSDESVAPFSWITTDPDERVLVTLEVSLNEYVALATAVDVGRDIAYNNDSFKIWWIWVRAYQMLDFCARMLECMETNPAIQSFLTGFVGDAVNGVKGKPLTDSQREQPLQNNAGDCDLDTLWGSCLYTVQILNRLNEDFFEQIEALTNNQEMLAYIVGAIPILETLPVDEFIELADKVREFVAETYAAGYDVDYEQELACGLFCAARANNCSLDMTVLTDFFFARAQAVTGFENAFETAKTIVSAMASWEEVLGEEIVDTMMAANVGFLSFLNSAFGMDFGTFALQAKSGIPDDDWQALCDECDFGACYRQTYEFAELLSGAWVDDVDYGRFARADAGGESAEFEIVFAEPKTLVSFSFYNQVLGSFGANNRDTGSVKLYMGATLLSTLYSFDLPNNHGYLWSPPAHTNRGVVDSVVGAGTTFDRIVFEHTHMSLRADVRGEVCIEEAPPSSCVDCGTFTDADVPVTATFNGSVWIPDDVRINAESQTQYGGTYIALSSSAGTDEMFYNTDDAICADRIKLYYTASGVTGGSIDIITNGDTHTYALGSSGSFTLTDVLDTPVPIASIIFRMTAGTGSISITLIKIAECSD